ncbi:hypothetical protein [Nitrosomonas sp. Nm51]|uniref:hypothetical protein n=1 Tax=Nitrosomonas sp. Nm51 TaxID=133720 RepID=UPI0015A599DA|nr:hypothetical protein [Nitrosomonas sp. Nm51]
MTISSCRSISLSATSFFDRLILLKPFWLIVFNLSFAAIHPYETDRLGATAGAVDLNVFDDNVADFRKHNLRRCGDPDSVGYLENPSYRTCGSYAHYLFHNKVCVCF